MATYVELPYNQEIVAMSITLSLSWSIWDPWCTGSMNMHTKGFRHVAVSMSLLRMCPIPTLICVWNLWAPAPHDLRTTFFFHPLPQNTCTSSFLNVFEDGLMLLWPQAMSVGQQAQRAWTCLNWAHGCYIEYIPSVCSLSLSCRLLHICFQPSKSWTYQKKIRWWWHASFWTR